MIYRVYLSPKATRFLRKAPTDLQKQIDKALLLLADGALSDSSIKRLVGTRIFRKRIADHRIIFAIDHEHKTIVIYRIGHRKNVYR